MFSAYRYYSRALDILFNFKETAPWNLQKKVNVHLSQITGARVCSRSWDGAIALKLQWKKFKKCKENSVKYYTLNSTTPVGSNAMFPQITKL